MDWHDGLHQPTGRAFAGPAGARWWERERAAELATDVAADANARGAFRSVRARGLDARAGGRTARCDRQQIAGSAIAALCVC